jgi:uncharacterized protein with GYD domain
MAKYAIFFAYNADTWANMIKNPSDRAAAVRALVEPMGGNLEALYFMFGEWDGFAIVETTDSETAAAASIAVASTGAFKALQTHELIDGADMSGVLAKAGSALPGYRAPGS